MVEWKKLGEEATYYRGVTYNKKQEVSLNSGGTKILRANNIELNTNTLLFDDVKEISSDVRIKDYQWLQPHDILICAGSGSKEHVGKVAYITEKMNYAYGGFMGKIVTSDKLSSRFLFHVITGQLFKKYLETALNSTTINNLNSSIIYDFVIPIPSLEEQTRIVGILDTFTSAIDNLKEQIAQRRKQYEYYREQLLDLEGKPGVEMKPLGEIGEFIRGNGIQKNDFVEVGFSCIHYGQIHARYGFSASKSISKIEESLYKRCKKAQKGDVVLATTSEDAEGVAKPLVWLGNEDAAVSGDAFVFHHNQNGKFMGHQFLTHRFMQFKKKYATGAKVVRISGENMAKYKVALPPLDEQSRIVSILDTFEASIQNLEAQLKEREKQYEYYRNKLLTFE